MFTVYGYVNSLLDSDSPQDIRPLMVGGCGHFILTGEERQNVFRPNGRQDYQIIYVRSGQGYYTFDGEEQIIKAGHIIFFYRGEPQFYHYLGEDEPDIYWLHFSGSRVMEELLELKFTERIYEVEINSVYSRIFDDIIQELQFKHQHYSMIIDAELKVLLCTIARDISIQRGLAVPRSLEVERAVKIFHTQFNLPFSLKDYAESQGMSPGWFTRIFRRQMGVSPQQYLMNIRINHACELLATDCTIAAVGENVGYSDALYFSRIFKKYTGVSPSEFRKSIFAP